MRRVAYTQSVRQGHLSSLCEAVFTSAVDSEGAFFHPEKIITQAISQLPDPALVYAAPFTKVALEAELLDAIRTSTRWSDNVTPFSRVQRYQGNRRGDIIKNTANRVKMFRGLEEDNQTDLKDLPEIGNISLKTLTDSPILHRFFIVGAQKAIGRKYKGVSLPMLAMLWIGLVQAFKQDGDPAPEEHSVAYKAAILHLKDCGTLEAVQNAIWGEDRPWITDPALAAKGAKEAGAAPQGASTVAAPARTGATAGV